MPTNTDKLTSRTISKEAIEAATTGVSTTKDYQKFWAGPAKPRRVPDRYTVVQGVSNSSPSPASPPPIEYVRYPMWLNHPRLDPVIVYDEAQEAEYKAKGYSAPGTPDPHGYLVSRVSDKLDDAIRAMNAQVETRIKDGLRDLYTKVVELVRAETQGRRPRQYFGDGYYGDEYDPKDIGAEIETEATKTTMDIMSAVREIAKSSG